MTGRLVSVTNLDSVRVEVLGEGRALTVPAAVVLAADRVLRFALVEQEDLAVDLVDNDDGRGDWQAALGNHVTRGDTPWGAIVALAEDIERGNL